MLTPKHRSRIWVIVLTATKYFVTSMIERQLPFMGMTYDLQFFLFWSVGYGLYTY